MNLRRMRMRVDRMEKRFRAKHDGGHTLEEMCRAMWQQDKKEYLEMAEEHYELRFFARRFEHQEAERAAHSQG